MSANRAEGKLIVKGRVTKLRDLGGIIFVDLKYGRHQCSLVGRRDILPEPDFLKVRSLRAGDFLECLCRVEQEHVLASEVLNIAESTQKSFFPAAQLSVLEAYGELLQYLRAQLKEDGYLEVRLPSIHYGHTKAESFGVDFFGHSARLTTSNALHLSAVASHLGMVFSLQRFFRAEPSKTSKHLAEFDMLEVAALGQEREEAMDYIERLIKGAIDSSIGVGIKESRGELAEDVSSPFRRIPYQALDAEYNLRGKGLGRREREIAKEGPVFVTDLPRKVASWSARPVDRNYSRSFNLLLPRVGEVAEGSERATRTALSRKFSYLGLEDSLGWYRHAFAYPDCRMSGFGLGVERLAMWLFGLSNIRQLTPFHRDQHFSEIRAPGSVAPAGEEEV